MDWVELIVHTTTEGSEAVSGLMIEQGAGGTMVEDRADIPDPSKPHGIWEIIDPKLLDDMPEDVLVHAWFQPDESFPARLNALQLSLEGMKSTSPEYGTLKLDRKAVRDEDWSEVWKKFYKPFYIVPHLVIKPSWESFTPQDGDQIMELDPGMAFGSGTHETTGMCMAMLADTVHGGEEIIDMGTGSGILAIGAAMMGAKSVLAIDIDPDAVRVAGENVRRNTVADRITVREGNLLEREDAICDICVANIISDIIIRFGAPLMEHIRPGGLFLCSGVTSPRGDEVQESLEKAGYIIERRLTRGEWVAFHCRRP